MSFVIIDLKAHRFAMEQNEAITHAQKGIQTMVKEIREASISDAGDYPVSAADSQELIFFADIDKDLAVERVRYYLEGSDLKKGTIEPSGWPVQYSLGDEQIIVLSKYVRNGSDPIFYYYDGLTPSPTSTEPLAAPADVDEVRLIRMYLKINFNPMIAPDNFELDSYAQIRNLKDNL